MFLKVIQYWGLIQILISYSRLSFQLFSFWKSYILIRYFPKTSNKTNLISFTFLLCLIGFLFFLFLFLFFFQNSFLKFIDATQLLNDNFYLIGFLVFSISFYDLFSSISQFSSSTTPVFLNETYL